jgi:hypothetical protein
MTDPLRPFADLIRSLWRSRAASTARTAAATGSAPAAGTQRALHEPRIQARVRSLQSHLRARIAESGGASPAKMREAFVEAVILHELGEQLAPDASVSELVSRVSEQLASDPEVGERLDRLLTRLASEPHG